MRDEASVREEVQSSASASEKRSPAPQRPLTDEEKARRRAEDAVRAMQAIAGNKRRVSNAGTNVGRQSTVRANSIAPERKRSSEANSVDDFGDLLKQSFRLDLNDVNGEVVRLKWGARKKENRSYSSGVPGEEFQTATVMKYGKGMANELVATSFSEGQARPAELLRRLLQLDGSPFVQAPPPPVVTDQVGHSPTHGAHRAPCDSVHRAPRVRMPPQIAVRPVRH